LTTRFRLIIEFDGRPFMGWQRQAHGPSVQGALEDAALTILGEPVTIHAAGRTDAGVHGLGMVTHLDVAKAITPFRLMEGLNALLRPHPVAVLSCDPVSDNFHARFSCVARHYQYDILNRRAPLTLDAGQVWRLPGALDSDAMHDAAQILVGRHDFTTFRSVHCQADSPMRTLDRLDVGRDGSRITIHASARSFLHHQVRSMVGCLSLVGQGKWTAETLRGALAARDRAALGFNAPPDGLYFVRADYP
jgi:tRNA pseudouridine38-40 synthase